MLLGAGLMAPRMAQAQSLPKVDRSLLQAYPTLSVKTREWRWGRIRKLMQDKKVDALLMLPGGQNDDPTSYLTNAGGATLFFPLKGEPIAYTPSGGGAMSVDSLMKSEAAGIESWVRDWRFGQGNASDLVATLKERGLSNSRIGTVGLLKTGHFSRRAGNWESNPLANFIKTQLPKSTLVELWNEYVQLWLVKNEEELVMFRKAAVAAEVAAELFAEACKPGNTLAEVMIVTTAELTRYGVNISRPGIGGGPDGGRGIAWMQNGLKPPVIQKGDLICSELFCSIGPIASQCQMTVSVGEPTAEKKKLAALARESYEIGIKTLRPGITFGELAEAMSKPNRREGAYHLSPLVHTLNPLEAVTAVTEGIKGERGFTGLRERFGEVKVPELPLDRGDLVMEENMTVQFEPNSCYGQTYVNIGGNLIVTKNGCEELNDLPNRMIIVST